MGDRRALSILDVAVVVGVVLVLWAMVSALMPGAREPARRIQCINNLKMLGLAAANYESAHGTFPAAGFSRIDPASGRCEFGFSALVALDPYIEVGGIFNAVNFSLVRVHPANATIAGARLSNLWCPADRTICETANIASTSSRPLGARPQAYSSYGVVTGPWNLALRVADPNLPERIGSMGGPIFGESANSLDSIADGLSSTLVFGEFAHGRLPANLGFGPYGDRERYHWWHSGHWNDTQIEAMYPPNADLTLKALPPHVRAMNLGSMHPGGANVAFADGSVRFLTDSIDCWPIDPTTGSVAALGYDPRRRLYGVAPGARTGVYQRLSTRDGGETIPPDSY